MNRPDTVLPSGTPVRTHKTLHATEGFPVAPKHVEARRADAPGTIEGLVGGHGGDVYWVRHPGAGVLAPYGFYEFELGDRPDDPGNSAVPIAA
jgi:hypothetical protein